jgi:hypothetical protein
LVQQQPKIPGRNCWRRKKRKKNRGISRPEQLMIRSVASIVYWCQQQVEIPWRNRRYQYLPSMEDIKENPI